MQFLDAIGLAYFWEKIKSWVGKNYLSLKGGNIEGSIQIDNDEGIGLRIIDGTSYSNKSLTISPTRITMSYIDDDSEGGHPEINDLDIQKGLITARSFTMTGGTATQVLMADGSVRTLNAANGICGLDANGRIPLAQLGNLDTSLFKLVTSLPSSGESNKIYIVKDGSDANDVYQEYYYTNGAWEKIGTHTVKVDLTPYAKKTEAVTNVDFQNIEADGSYVSNTSIRNLVYTLGDGRKIVAAVPLAEPRTTGARPYIGQNGFMRASDKAKLDGIADGANNYTLPTASASVLGGILIGYGTSGRNYAVLLDGSGKAYVNVPWTDTNTTYDLSPYAKTADVNAALAKKVDVVSGKGLSTNDFTAAYKSKLDGIASNANNYSLPLAANGTRGGIKVGYAANGRNYPVQLSGEKAYVNVPWTDTNTTYGLATSTNDGLMKASDKAKLDGIASGATADSAITTAEIDTLFT